MPSTDRAALSVDRANPSIARDIYTAWHRSISPSYVFRLPSSLATAICALPLEDYWIFIGSTWETIVNERSRTPVLMHGTHCRNICDKLHRLTFSSALWKRSYSCSRRVQRIRDILFNGKWAIYVCFTYLLTYLLQYFKPNAYYACMFYSFFTSSQAIKNI